LSDSACQTLSEARQDQVQCRHDLRVAILQSDDRTAQHCARDRLQELGDHHTRLSANLENGIEPFGEGRGIGEGQEILINSEA